MFFFKYHNRSAHLQHKKTTATLWSSIIKPTEYTVEIIKLAKKKHFNLLNSLYSNLNDDHGIHFIK